jgi:hypothetical protein
MLYLMCHVDAHAENFAWNSERRESRKFAQGREELLDRETPRNSPPIHHLQQRDLDGEKS